MVFRSRKHPKTNKPHHVMFMPRHAGKQAKIYLPVDWNKNPHSRPRAFENAPCSSTRRCGGVSPKLSENSQTHVSKQPDCMAMAWPVASSGARQHLKWQDAAPGGSQLRRFLWGCLGAAWPTVACSGHGQHSAQIPSLSASLAMCETKDIQLQA